MVKFFQISEYSYSCYLVINIQWLYKLLFQLIIITWSEDFPFYNSSGVYITPKFTMSLRYHLFTKPFYNHLPNTNTSTHDIDPYKTQITIQRYHITHSDHKHTIYQHRMRIPTSPHPWQHLFSILKIIVIMATLVSVK